ncbi:MAG: DUF4190 domain-containing protein [Acidimicrobiales bacterium]
MNCANCGSPVEPGQVCPACGARQAPATAPADQPGWGRPPSQGDAGNELPTWGAPGATSEEHPSWGQSGGGQQLPAWGRSGGGNGGYVGPGGLPAAPPYGGTSGYAAGPKTNSWAIASLVCSLLGLVCGVGAILGVIFGFVARGQIRRSDGVQKGGGLALAGIVVGAVLIAVSIAVAILIVSRTKTGG